MTSQRKSPMSCPSTKVAPNSQLCVAVRRVGVVKVQVQAATPVSGFVDLLECQLGKARFSRSKPDETFVLRCHRHVHQLRPKG